MRRALWVLLLLLLATGYYGSYFQHGINFRDEGGTVTLLAKRMHDGEVPFRDVVLGYNVGWFFPIVGLFKITGVSFVALRVYFFALSTLAAVLGFLTVERAARHAGWRRGALLVGFAVGLLLIVVPGMTFKNYNPLAAVANSWALLGFVLATTSREACWRAVIGGLVLGMTWLVRIDLGTFFTVLWLGSIVARLVEKEWQGRRKVLAGCLGLVTLGVAVPHAPVVWDAHRRGYLEQFAGAYPDQWEKLFIDLRKVTSPSKQAAAAPAKPGTAAPANEPARAASATIKSETLARPKLLEFTDDNWEDNAATLLIYLPLVSLIPLALWAAIRWLAAAWRGSDVRTPLAALVLVGGALTMFPQYFFWRPDPPHLSEFGPAFWCAAFGATMLLGAAWGRSWREPSRWLIILLSLHGGLWLVRMLPDRWCGTIAARSNRQTWFVGENGVQVYEQRKTVEWMEEVRDAVLARTTDSDYLLAYPYHPAFNIITNRRTYEKNVYIDNAKASAAWNQGAINRMEKFKPRVVIISGWSINGTPVSRFKNWAGGVYQHLHEHYDLVGVYGDKKNGVVSEEDSYELFVRRPELGSLP